MKFTVEDARTFFRSREIIPIPEVRIPNRLTSGKYKAFILFADEDINFALKIIKFLEENQLNVCIGVNELNV